MAIAPPKICGYFGCGRVVQAGVAYCSKHKRHKTKKQKMYNNEKWKKSRRVFLANNQFCVECKKKDLLVIAEVVDHIHPHGGNDSLFWNVENWQALCKSCHSKKTREEAK